MSVSDSIEAKSASEVVVCVLFDSIANLARKAVSVSTLEPTTASAVADTFVQPVTGVAIADEPLSCSFAIKYAPSCVYVAVTTSVVVVNVSGVGKAQ